MNSLFSILGLLLLLEPIAFLHDNITVLIKLDEKALMKLKFISGIIGVFFIAIMIILLQASTYQFGYSMNYISLNLFDVTINRGFVFLFLLLSFVENAYFIIAGIRYFFPGVGSFRHGSGSEAESNHTVTPKQLAAVANAAKLLQLGPNQTKALAYVYAHKSITIDGFQSLCPETDRPALEQDLQGMVRLGLIAAKGDKFIIT